jgi:hypothetical protein
MPNCSTALTDWSTYACLPSGVDNGRAAKTPTTTIVRTSIPNHFGWAATLAKVAPGEVMTPMNRAKTFIGAGVDPAATVVSAIFFLKEMEGRPGAAQCPGTT